MDRTHTEVVVEEEARRQAELSKKIQEKRERVFAVKFRKAQMREDRRATFATRKRAGPAGSKMLLWPAYNKTNEGS